MLLVAALVPAAGIAAWGALAQRSRDEERTRHHALTLARTAAREYERWFDQVQGLLTGLATLAPVQDRDGVACNELFARILPHTQLANLGAIRPDGTVFCSAVPASGPVDVSDRAYFRRAVASRDLVVAGFHVGRVSRLPEIGLALPVRAPDGELLAVLYAGLDANALAPAVEAMPLPPGAKLLLVDADGTVLGASPPPARQWLGQQVPFEVLGASLGDATDGVIEDTGHDGAERLMAFASLVPSRDSSRLTAVVRTPTDFVGQRAWERLATAFLSLLVTAVLALLAVRYFGGARIVRRLDAMAVATERIAAGDLAARSGVAHEGDEIGRLAASLDAMAERLERNAREREGLEEALRQSQKLDALGRLAGGIAHDFNNLLTAILSFGRFLREDLPPDDARQEDVAEILKAGERAAALTKQLLAFSRKQPSEPRVIEVGSLVAGAEKLLCRLIGEEYRLVVRVEAGTPPVLVDPHQLDQVLLNLVVNARDATPGGGTIELSVGPGRRSDGDAAWAVLAVRDDGIGMGPEVKRHLFELFFTTKERGKGTGLGLATCFGIVRSAGGTIEVESEPGRGSTFRVWLPPAAAEAEEEVPGRLLPGPRGIGQTILVVEDDDCVRALASRVLDGHGYRVLAARGPLEAFERSRAEPGAIALLLSDVAMPGMSGPDLARVLAAERPELRVLFVTGHAERVADPEDRATLLEKPFTPEQLIARVRERLAIS